MTKSLTYQEVLILSNLLWVYHRNVAKQRNVDTSKWWWFVRLVDKFNYVEYQRWAVDIYKDLLANQHDISGKPDLPDIYMSAIEKLSNLLKEFLSNKEK